MTVRLSFIRRGDVFTSQGARVSFDCRKMFTDKRKLDISAGNLIVKQAKWTRRKMLGWNIDSKKEGAYRQFELLLFEKFRRTQ